MRFFENMTVEQAKMLSPLSLAFVGDAVYTLYARSKVIQHSDAKNGALHTEATKLVKASGQAEMADAILSLLTEEEMGVFKRARNSKTNSVAKNASIGDYKKATGFEALVGFLYLTGQDERLKYLLNERESVCQQDRKSTRLNSSHA